MASSPSVRASAAALAAAALAYCKSGPAIGGRKVKPALPSDPCSGLAPMAAGQGVRQPGSWISGDAVDLDDDDEELAPLIPPPASVGLDSGEVSSCEGADVELAPRAPVATANCPVSCAFRVTSDDDHGRSSNDLLWVAS